MRHPEKDSSHLPEVVRTATPVRRRQGIKLVLAILFILVTLGFVIPGHPGIPVEGATHLDWEEEGFWRQSPDGPELHKGIDIATTHGTPAIAATPGLILYTARSEQSGKAVTILGPKWRVHTYANLQQVDLDGGFVSRGTMLGAIGTPDDSGKSHLHYSVVTLVPYPWRFSRGPQGWKQMFYLNPGQELGSPQGEETPT